MSIQHIRDKYRLPVKIGTTVRLNEQEVKVIWSPDAYLTIRLPDGKKETRHPFDFDYLIDGEWVSGGELQRRYDASWDAWNGKAKQGYSFLRRMSRLSVQKERPIAGRSFCLVPCNQQQQSDTEPNHIDQQRHGQDSQNAQQHEEKQHDQGNDAQFIQS